MFVHLGVNAFFIGNNPVQNRVSYNKYYFHSNFRGFYKSIASRLDRSLVARICSIWDPVHNSGLSSGVLSSENEADIGKGEGNWIQTVKSVPQNKHQR